MVDSLDIAGRSTVGMSTDDPTDLATRVERLVERQLVRLLNRGVEAGEQLVREAAPGNRLALVAMFMSLATAAALLAFIVFHEVGTSRFEEAIEGLSDVLRHQNPALSKELNDVERKMHKR
jgi:hypothetical protein